MPKLESGWTFIVEVTQYQGELWKTILRAALPKCRMTI